MYVYKKDSDTTGFFAERILKRRKALSKMDGFPPAFFYSLLQ